MYFSNSAFYYRDKLMKDKHIENYLLKIGADPKQRIKRNNGGQYFINFLKQFAEHVREETLIEAQNSIKHLRKNNKNQVLTRKDAESLMKIGKKLTHMFFLKDEWMISDEEGLIYEFYDGVEVTYDEFWKNRNNEEWETGWQIFE